MFACTLSALTKIVSAVLNTARHALQTIANGFGTGSRIDLQAKSGKVSNYLEW